MTLALDEAGDAELVALARAGHQPAFRALTERNRDAVYRLARSATGNAEDALDVTQEAFIAAFGALDRFDTTRPFRFWIARITINKARDWARRRAVRRLLTLPWTDSVAQTPLDEAEPDAIVGDRRELARVAQAIASLPVRLNEVLLLRTVEAMSEAETAAALGISQKAVETRLYRARRQLALALRTAEG